MPAARPSDRVDEERPWSDEESELAFRLLGDRFIEAMLNFRRSVSRQTLQQQLYTVDEVELTPAQVDALQALARQDAWGAQEFAREVGVDQSTATRMLDPLVDLGLVSRRIDPANRRRKIVASTARGRRAAKLVRDARRGAMREQLGRMSPARRLMFVELLEDFVDIVNDTNLAESERINPLPKVVR